MAFITELWSDGACSGNPGPGGWAYILIARRPDGSVAKKLEGHGGEKMTTNNRMEMKAALKGLLVLTRPTTITIHPDSAYLANAFTEGWLSKCKATAGRAARSPSRTRTSGSRSSPPSNRTPSAGSASKVRRVETSVTQRGLSLGQSRRAHWSRAPRAVFSVWLRWRLRCVVWWCSVHEELLVEQEGV